MAKVLLTGASGFIGGHLVRKLAARGDDVTCLVRKSSRVDQLASLGVRLIVGDITDRESLLPAIRGQDIVFQLAGCLRALQVEMLYQVNVDGVRNVAQTCAEQTTPPVLVLVSSLAACGPAGDDRPRKESDPPSPVSNYGESKRAGELAARQWAGQVPMTIVRPPMVIGEADPATREIFTPVARLGIHMVPSWRDYRFSIIHAADLAELLVQAAEQGKRVLPGDACEGGRDLQPDAHRPNSGQPGLTCAAAAQGCYFAACGEDPTYADLGRMIGRALGRCHVLVVRTGRVIVWTVAGVSQLVSYLRGHPYYFDLDKAREARAGSWTCSPQAAIDELDFKVNVPLAERLRQTAAWYRSSGWL
jgi:dihydroflavonol-4-reductase